MIKLAKNRAEGFLLYCTELYDISIFGYPHVHNIIVLMSENKGITPLGISMINIRKEEEVQQNFVKHMDVSINL